MPKSVPAASKLPAAAASAVFHPTAAAAPAVFHPTAVAASAVVPPTDPKPVERVLSPGPSHPGTCSDARSLAELGSSGKRRELTQTRRQVRRAPTDSKQRAHPKLSKLDVSLGKKIGAGTFGDVFEATLQRSSSAVETVAVKRIKASQLSLQRELVALDILRRKRHPNIVRFHGHYATEECSATQPSVTYCNLVMELMPCTLQHRLDFLCAKGERMSCESIALYAYQITRAIAHLHGLGMAHRDLKPDNVLLELSRNRVKLCDFGNAKIMEEGKHNNCYVGAR